MSNMIPQVYDMPPFRMSCYLILIFGSAISTQLRAITASLDPAFGINGIATTNFHDSSSYDDGDDVAMDSVTQPDGKVILVGNVKPDFDSKRFMALARFNPDGSLDVTFGDQGKVATEYGRLNDAKGSGIALQPDGKIVVAGQVSGQPLAATSDTSGILTDSKMTLTRYHPNGSLDLAFGTGGKLTLAVPGASNSWASDVVLQSDGKILVVGNAIIGSYQWFVISRHHLDGSLDTSFDGDGVALPAVGVTNDNAESLLLQPDGKILIIGSGFLQSISSGGHWMFAITRLNSNGSMDTTFDGDGKNLVSVGTSHDHAFCLALQPDGKVIVGGDAYKTAGGATFALVRFMSNGAVDTSFGSSGTVSTDFSGDGGNAQDLVRSIHVRPDGRILATGNDNAARYYPDGSLDTSLDADGKLRLLMTATEMQTISNEAILFTGYDFNVQANDFSLMRYQQDGVLDGTFDADGQITLGFGTRTDNAETLELQADGRILSTGTVTVTRHTPNGLIDTTFGVNGKLIPRFTSTNSTNSSPAIRCNASGGIMIAGRATVSSKGVFGVAKYDSSGLFDTSFDIDGRLTTAIGATSDAATCADIQPDGRTLVAGSSFLSSLNRFALARYDANGSLDANFDGDGKLTTAFSSMSASIIDMVLMPDGRIVAAGTGVVNSTTERFAVARYLASGALDSSFNSTGMVTTSVGPNISRVGALAVQSDGKVLVVGHTINAGTWDWAIVRYNTNGTLDPTFDDDGRLILPVASVADDFAWSVSLLAEDKILIGGSSGGQMAVVCLNSDGSLDTTFGNNGNWMLALGIGTSEIRDIKIQPDGKLVILGDSLVKYDRDTVLLRMEADVPIPETYEAWASRMGLGATAADATAVPFHDGIPNLLKFAFNMHGDRADVGVLQPSVGVAGLPHFSVVKNGTGNWLRVEYVRRKSGLATYEVQTSETLFEGSFEPMIGATVVADIDANWQRVVVEELLSPILKPWKFARVQVTLPTE